jgi:hypothetical protein
MISAPTKLAAIFTSAGADTQGPLAQAVTDWRAAGAAIVGVLAQAHGLPDRTCGAGFLRDIVSDKPYPIYLETAPLDTSCHLDAAGVDSACAAIIPQIADSDLVVLNKFGKLEAAGAGLAPAFAAAVAAGKPVLTTVSKLHRAAWLAFAPGVVVLPAERTALNDWWRKLRGGETHQIATAQPGQDGRRRTGT